MDKFVIKRTRFVSENNDIPDSDSEKLNLGSMEQVTQTQIVSDRSKNYGNVVVPVSSSTGIVKVSIHDSYFLTISIMLGEIKT